MKPGDIVTDFTLPDQHGMPQSLVGLLDGGPVVLFFYPAALTPGCTAESCHFRDMSKEFAEVGARPVGVSKDPVDRQRHFAEQNSLTYPLLSDLDGRVAEQFGVQRRIIARAVKRHTFIIDQDRKVLDVFRSEWRMNAHADQALAVLRDRSSV